MMDGWVDQQDRMLGRIRVEEDLDMMEEEVDEMLQMIKEEVQEEEEVNEMSKLMEKEVEYMSKMMEELEDEVDGHPSQYINEWMH